MRGRLNIILAILVGFNLVLVIHHSILAQSQDPVGDKKYENKTGLTEKAGRSHKSPRVMISEFQQEIKEIQARISENPSSPEVGKLKKKAQWNNRRIKELLASANKKGEDDGDKIEIRREKSSAPGLERYMIIAQKNLFTPLGTGGEVKRQEFAVIGILGSGTKNSALIQLIDGSASYYVAQGETFGNGAKLVNIGKNDVTIVHEGNEIELKLGEGTFASQSRRVKEKDWERRGKQPSDDERKQMEIARRKEEESRREMAEKHEREIKKREDTERKIHYLHQEREKIQMKIAEMEESGYINHDTYKKMEKIDQTVRKLEYSMDSAK